MPVDHHVLLGIADLGIQRGFYSRAHAAAALECLLAGASPRRAAALASVLSPDDDSGAEYYDAGRLEALNVWLRAAAETSPATRAALLDAMRAG